MRRRRRQSRASGMPSRASVPMSRGSACARNSATSAAPTQPRFNVLSRRCSPRVANISSPGISPTKSHDTGRSKHFQGLDVITKSHRSVPLQGDCEQADRSCGSEMGRRDASRPGATSPADESCARTSLSPRLLRAGLHQPVGAHRRDDLVSAKHRQGRQRHYSRPVRALPHRPRLRRGRSHRPALALRGHAPRPRARALLPRTVR